MAEPHDTLDLLDYRRTMTGIYRQVRQSSPGEDTWMQWRQSRDDLFSSHSQTAIDPEDVPEFDGLPFFDYAAGWRVEATVEPVAEEELAVGHSDEGFTAFRRFGQIEIELQGDEIALSLYWLDSYGGGVFLPFRDGTSSGETYGGGTYSTRPKAPTSATRVTSSFSTSTTPTTRAAFTAIAGHAPWLLPRTI